MLSHEVLEDLRRRADIVRYVSERVPLNKAGGSWKGRCPFHKDTNPSLSVRADPPIFHCFGCGQKGDIFKFAMLYARVRFPEAVRDVALWAGVTVEPPTQHPHAESGKRERRFRVLEAATEHFFKNLWRPAGREALGYLLGRGLSRATLERVRAGAAADSWTDLMDHLVPRFSPAELLEAGLVVRKDGAGECYDRFRHRAIFPVADEFGRVVGFAGRALGGSTPKYLNSPKTHLYDKGAILYGLSWAREAISRERRIVLVEGYVDVLRALDAGVTTAVAICGTTLTGAQARLLRRFTEHVVLCLDQDRPGQEATRASVDALLGRGLKLRVAELPEGHDPHSYIQQGGAAAFHARLRRAQPAMAWLISKAAAAYDTTTPEGRAAYLRAVMPALLRLTDGREQARWLAEVAKFGHFDQPGPSDIGCPEPGSRGAEGLMEFCWASTAGEHGTASLEPLESAGWRRVAPHRWYPGTWLLERLPSPDGAGSGRPAPTPQVPACPFNTDNGEDDLRGVDVPMRRRENE